jgi:hypothetical protein
MPYLRAPASHSNFGIARFIKFLAFTVLEFIETPSNRVKVYKIVYCTLPILSVIASSITAVLSAIDWKPGLVKQNVLGCHFNADTDVSSILGVLGFHYANFARRCDSYCRQYH